MLLFLADQIQFNRLSQHLGVFIVADILFRIGQIGSYLEFVPIHLVLFRGCFFFKLFAFREFLYTRQSEQYFKQPLLVSSWPFPFLVDLTFFLDRIDLWLDIIVIGPRPWFVIISDGTKKPRLRTDGIL
jgi:hypothetical protein